MLISNLDNKAGDSLPCRNTLRKWTVAFGERIQRNVVSTLLRVKHFYVIIDIWSSAGMTHFHLGVTVAYYNPRTKRFENAALANCKFPHPHTGETIRAKLKEIFDRHGLSTSLVIRYITDKGSNIIKALSPFTVVQNVPVVANLDYVNEPNEAAWTGARPFPPSAQDEEQEAVQLVEMEVEFEDDEEEEAILAAYENSRREAGPTAELEEFVADMEVFEQAFPKRISCTAHGANLVFHDVIDDKESPIGEFRKKVLKLLKKFFVSGVANQHIKLLAGKKLLKVAKTRWISLYYVLKRLLQLKEAIISACRDRIWGIDFEWEDVKKYVALLEPLATVTTVLEGDKYPTAANVIPSVLGLEEHFVTTKTKDPTMADICNRFLNAMDRRFGIYKDVNDPTFDQTFLFCTMLNPQKSVELNQELYEEGLRRMFPFMQSEISVGHILRPVESLEGSDPDAFSQPSANVDQAPTSIKRRRTAKPIDGAPTVMGPSTWEGQLEQEVRDYIKIIDHQQFELKMDAADFWNSNLNKFPLLAPIALQYQAMPATSASAERMFSIAGLSVSGKRVNVNGDLLEAETIARYNRKYFEY